MYARLTPAQKFVLVLSAIVLVVGIFAGHRLGRTGDDDDVRERVEYTLPDAGDVKVTVHVVGAVPRPGLYALSAGSRTRDAIAAAGGFRADSDRESVNLAAFVDDGEQIRVGALDAPATPAQAQHCASPQSVPTTTVPSPVTSPPARTASGAAASHTPSSGSSTAARPEPDDTIPEFARSVSPGRVSLNRAGLEELQRLPGIGPELAKKIIYHRNMNGPFSGFEELHAVPGIGPATVEKIRVSATLN